MSQEILGLEKRPEQAEQIRGEKLIFGGVGKDIYNITAPFEDEDGIVRILGRVESRKIETDSKAIFFKEDENGVWMPDKNKLEFDMQDPFFTKIGNEIIIGGVEVSPNSEKSNELTCKTVFYKGTDLNDLEKFAEGPEGMKDIRLVKLKNGKIGVFTRPGKKIAFTTINSLTDFNEENLNKAEIIEGMFAEEEWGGANELHLLENGKIGVLGHVAHFDDEENRHYYAMVFLFDPETRQASEVKIIATAEDFEKGAMKREDLEDVIFSGGLKIDGDGKITLYVGIRDAEAGKIIVREATEESLEEYIRKE